MSILARILEFESPDEEFYFLKLEALWVLINLSMCDTDDLKLILMSNFPKDPTKEITIDKEIVSQDFEQGKSDIIVKIDGMMQFTL